MYKIVSRFFQQFGIFLCVLILGLDVPQVEDSGQLAYLHAYSIVTELLIKYLEYIFVVIK